MTISEDITVVRQRMHLTDAEELVVSDSVTSDDLRHLLDTLIQEDCVHSWRNFGPGGTLDELLKWENERRPTILFFFYLKQGGTSQIVAASAVADRLSRDFPHSGFPVLGRCCIMPKFRERGFYRSILQYRLEYCRTEYGDNLKAIHLGAVNQRISHVITNHGLPGWPRFTHLGEEELRVGSDIRRVDAFLLLMPDFLRRMQATLAGGDAPSCVVELRDALARAESGSIHNFGLLVKETFTEARQLGWFDVHDSNEIDQLLLFCRSVPLVGFK